MPVFDDFKCDNECKDEKGNIIIETHAKSTALAEHEEHLCPICKEPMRKLFGSPVIDVAEGKLGNEKNNFSNNIVSKPSIFGRFKGTRIKTIK